MCADVPPPLTPADRPTCLFTVVIAGSGSDVEGDVPVTVSLLDVTGGGSLSVNTGLTSLISTAVTGGLVTSTGAGSIAMAGVGSLSDLATNADLRLLGGSTTFVSGTIVNDGRITLADGAGAPSAGLSTTLDGSGTVELAGDAAILGSTLRPWSQNASHTIEGFGLFQGQAITNGNLIRANVSGETLRLFAQNTLVNDGVLQATGGGILRVEQSDVDNDSGVLDAQAGSTIELTSSVVRGGLLTGAGEVAWDGNGALLVGTSGPTIADAGQRVRAGAVLVLDDLVNSQTVVIDDGGLVQTTGSSVAQYTGAGDFLLDGPNASFGVAGSSQWVQGAAHTLHGRGLVRGFQLINEGSVLADQASSTLDLRVSNSVPAADVTNTGVIGATGGGVLHLEDTDIANQGGTLLADAGSIVEIANGTFRGGSITGAGEFQWGTTGTLGDTNGALTTTDALHRVTGTLVRMAGPVQNDGRIVVEAGGLFSPNSTLPVVSRLEGSGSLELRDATSEVGGIVAGYWENGVGHRLEGVGTVSAGAFYNEGILAAGLRDPGLEAGSLSLVVIQTELGASSVFEVELGGTNQGVDYDFVSASRVSLGGVFDVSFLDGFESEVLGTDLFTVMTGEVTLTNAFSNVANGDRVLTSDGLGSFLVHYGAGSLFDTRSVVLSDFELVPEPSTALLVLLGSLGLAKRRA